MKIVLHGICILALITGSSKVSSAQWPAYANSRVPKTASGQPDLNAPAPRTPEGKPDLSIERFRRPNFGNLEIQITVDDPKAYTRPWTVTVKQRIQLNDEMLEFICIDKDAAHYIGGQK
jgi:hypothetical protein